MGRSPWRTFHLTFPLIVSLLLLLPLHAGAFPRTVTDASGRSVTIPERPRRIFSGGLNLDSTLLKLVSPDRVAAVSRFARNPDFSHVHDTAAQLPVYPQVRTEALIKHDPDLVVLTRYTRADIRSQILDLDVPVVITRPVNTLQDIQWNTRLIARSVGAETAARRWLGRMEKRLQSHDPLSNPPLVLLYSYSGTVPGKNTVPDLILRTAGVINLAAQVGLRGWKVISPEQILASQPDWILFESRNRDQLVSKLKNDPALSSLSAVQKNRYMTAPPKYLTVASPFLYRAVEYWHERFSRD